MSNLRNNREIERLLEDVSTPESSQSEEDPFQNDGEYDSDENYQPDFENQSSSSDDETYVSRRRVSRPTAISSSSSSSNPNEAGGIIPGNNIDLHEVIEPHFTGATQPPVAFQSIPDIISDETFVEPTEIIQQTDTWSHTVEPIPEFQFDASSIGIQVHIHENSTPLDVFKIVLSDQLLHYMISRTNAYGVKLTSQNRPATRNSRRASFRPVEYEELLMFFGLCLLQGQVKFPERRKLFSNDPLYFHPIFSYVMSGRRFDQILRCLSIAEDNSKGEKKSYILY